MITQARLREIVHYDPLTGVFTWLISRGRGRAGERAGHIDFRGYRLLSVDGRLWRSARLAFIYMGEAVPEIVDHINGDRGDDAWANLRSATASQNNWNRAAHPSNPNGFKGVSKHSKADGFTARISAKGVYRYLGYFSCPIEAALAYDAAAIDLHGDFARLNFPDG